MPRFGALPAKLKPFDRERAAHLFLLLEDLLDLAGDVRRVVERRAVGRLHDHHEVVLILVRHEAGRHHAIDPHGERQQPDEHQRHRPLQRDDDPQHRDIAAREPVDHLVDAAEEPALFAFGPQNQRGHRRRERQRVERRQRHRERDRQRELLIEPARRAREERDRHEHRHQHQTGRDDRPDHFRHGRRRGVARRFAVIVDVPMNVLDDDNRIVDHQTGRERDAEQRQRVDRKSERIDERERADQRHRNRERRNDRAPPVLQEQEHDDDDQDDRFHQRRQHFVDRLRDHRDRVERDDDLQAWRKRCDSRWISAMQFA